MSKADNNFSKQDSVSLTKHFEVVIENLAKYIESRLQGTEKAVEQAKNSMDIRLVGMNEIRGTLADQAKNFPTKLEVKAELDALKREMADFREFKEECSRVPADIEGLKKDVVNLISSRDKMEGKASQEDLNKVQKSVDISKVISVVGIIVALLSLMMKVLEK